MAYEALLAETVLIRGHRGDQIDAYLARPLGTGPYPGVVVIHHMPGWDGPTKEIARRFAHHRYVAISPNLHFREGKATAEENSASYWDCSASRTRAPRRRTWRRPRKRSRSGGRPTSSTPTTTRGTRSSPSTARSIACMLLWMVGRRSSPGSRSTSTEPPAR